MKVNLLDVVIAGLLVTGAVLLGAYSIQAGMSTWMSILSYVGAFLLILPMASALIFGAYYKYVNKLIGASMVWLGVNVIIILKELLIGSYFPLLTDDILLILWTLSLIYAGLNLFFEELFDAVKGRLGIIG